MDVLCIGSDNPLGTAVLERLSAWDRHRTITLTSAASRWRSERQAKKAARKFNPQAILDLRLAWTVASGEVPQILDVERTHWLAKACERSAIPYLLISSDQVFAGQSGRNLREGDGQDAFSEPGFQLAEAENRVSNAAPSALILRTGPLFSADGDNLFSRILHAFDTQRSAVVESEASIGSIASDSESEGKAPASQSPGPAVLDDRHVFCPVACEDAARVIAAMLDQLGVGAQSSGVFHYCSGDRTTEFGFAETVLAASSQYSDHGAVKLLPRDDAPDAAIESRVLDCSRLRDNFAIKQTAWRGFIDPALRQFYSIAAKETPGEHS